MAYIDAIRGMRTKFKKKLSSVIALIAMTSVLMTSLPVDAQALRTGASELISNLSLDDKVNSGRIDIPKEKIDEEKPGYEINVNCYVHHSSDTYYGDAKSNKCYKYKVCDICSAHYDTVTYTNHSYKTFTTEKTCIGGRAEDRCINCGYVARGYIVPVYDPNNHAGTLSKHLDYPPDIETKKDGRTTIYCPACKKSWYEYIPVPEEIDKDSGSQTPGNQDSGNNGSASENKPSTGENGSNTTPGGTQTTNSLTQPEKKKSGNADTETTGDPVDVFSGAHLIDLTVMSAGGVNNITIGLSYKSNKTIKGFFGNGFAWNYESYVEESGEEIRLYHSPSSYVVYTLDKNKSVYKTETQGYELDEVTKNADGTVTLKSFGKTFDYNADNKLSRITYKTGKTVKLEYKENEIDLIDGNSGQIIYLYLNSNGLVERVCNEGSAEASFEYDSNNNLIKYIDVDGFVTSYTYKDNGQILSSTDADGNVVFTDFTEKVEEL